MKIPRGKSEYVNRRRTDNTLTTENGKRTNDDLQNITHKTKDKVTQTPLKTNNDLQNITHKTKDQVTQTPLKTNNDLQTIHIKLKIK